MSYIRPCNKCGQRISMREMPHGQWVPFDVSTEEPHVCGTQHEPDVSVKLKAKNKNREEDEPIDIGYEDDDVSDVGYEDDGASILQTINKAIREKKRIDITYHSYGGQTTSRQISPVKKFKYQHEDHLQAYCHLKKDERCFKIDSIIEAKITNKKAFKSKKIGKPKLKEYLEKVNLKNDKSSKEVNVSDYPGSIGPKNIREVQDDLKRTSKSIDRSLEIIFFLALIGAIISYIFG